MVLFTCATETSHIQTQNYSTRVQAPALTNSQAGVYFNHEKDTNPVGRVASDDKNKRTKLLNCKIYKNIGTINVRTIRNEEKKLLSWNTT